MTVTARLPDASEASLTRTLQTVAIPVFQFGIFSENDLSFFAGPNFNFGGRVHSNSNIYLAEGPGNTLSLADRVTSVGEIIRTNLANGNLSATQHGGTVRAITAPNAFRDLAMAEGSLVGAPGSAQNEPTWTNLSTGTYNHNIMTGRTGAKPLVLPITSFGGQPIGLIQRPAVNENVTNPNMLAERFYSLASLRILLSETQADILNRAAAARDRRAVGRRGRRIARARGRSDQHAAVLRIAGLQRRRGRQLEPVRCADAPQHAELRRLHQDRDAERGRRVD
jgi:hypothetical protein